MAMTHDARSPASAPGGPAPGASEPGRTPVLTLSLPIPSPPARLVWAAHWLWVYAGLAWCMASGERHDYWSYVEQWKLVLAGLDPWGQVGQQFGPNTYGPVQNVLAVFLPVHVLAPKVVMFLFFATAATMVLRRITRERPDWTALAVYVLAVPGNMLITLFAFGFGTNDQLVAAFLGFAILGRLDGRTLMPAFWLSLGILLKFYPALFVPMFMVERRRMDLRFGFAVAGFVTAGMAAAYAVWGDAAFGPFRYAAERDASFLSFWIPLRDLDDALTGGAIVRPLIRVNGILVMATAVATALLCWKRNLAWPVGLAFVILACLTMYKVGHQQFLMPWSIAVACLPLLRSREGDAAAIASVPYLLFLSGISYLHVLHDPYVFGHVGRWPYLAFPAAMLSIAGMLTVRSLPPARVGFMGGRASFVDR